MHTMSVHNAVILAKNVNNTIQKCSAREGEQHQARLASKIFKKKFFVFFFLWNDIHAIASRPPFCNRTPSLSAMKLLIGNRVETQRRSFLSYSFYYFIS